jgi:branched-chain amino acid transport system ATP-binding protein
VNEDELRIEGLRVERANREVLHGVDLTVRTGAITALLGPNGAGKSTLVLALAGLLPTTGGTAGIGDETITGKAPSHVRAAGLATVPEGHRVLKDMTVADNLRTAALLMPRKSQKGAVDRVLELFTELQALTGRMAGSLSGGQQQMLAIGQALVAGPRFLVIDEMSLGLAPVVVRRLAPAISRVAGSGVGVLLIEQFTQVALEVAEDAYALTQGRIALHESADVLRGDAHILESAYRFA